MNSRNARKDGSGAPAISSPRVHSLENFKRRYTGGSDWLEAKAVAAEWEAAGDWEKEPAPPIPPPVSDEKPATTIEQAVKMFLAEREEILAPNTYRKNSYILNSLKQYSATKGCFLLTQWTPIDVREFRISWGVAPSTATKYMEIVKSFSALLLQISGFLKAQASRSRE